MAVLKTEINDCTMYKKKGRSDVCVVEHFLQGILNQEEAQISTKYSQPFLVTVVGLSSLYKSKGLDNDEKN